MTATSTSQARGPFIGLVLALLVNVWRSNELKKRISSDYRQARLVL
jgi:uncharacterized membrane protein